MSWVAIFVLSIVLWRLWEDQKALRRKTWDLAERLDALEFPATVARLDRLSEDWAPKAAADNQRPGDASPAPAAPTTPAELDPPTVVAESLPDKPPPPRPASSAGDGSAIGVEPPQARRINLGEVLAERGLVWLGGGALALGGVFLVGYAAQQGWFTPIVRLAAAVGLAAVMLAVSELLRRRPGPRQQALASAVLAGAGASTLYATLWAAYALYHYVGPGLAALLLLAVSGLLLGLSRDRREPLALMALFGALVAPLITAPQDWSDAALALHTLGVAAAGLLVAWRRGWERTALAAAAGGLVLHLLTLRGGEPWRQLLTPVMLVAMALAWRSRRGGEPRPLTAAIAPVVTLLAALALLPTFGAVREAVSIAGATVASLTLTALLALAARRGWTSGWLLAAPAALLVAGLALAIALAHGTPLAVARIGALAAAAGLATASLAVFRLPRMDFAPAPLAVGAFLLSQLAGFGLGQGPGAGLVLLGTLPALVAAVWLGRRGSADRHQDLWTLSGAAGLLLAAFIAAPDWSRPAAFAAMGLAFALGQRRLGWLGLSIAAIASVGLATSSALSPQAILTTLGSASGAGRGVVVILVAAIMAGLAAWRVRPAPPVGAARQVLGAGATGLALLALFLGLRFAAAGPTPAIGLLLESALRTLLLATAGTSSLLMLRDVRGVIARAGPHVLLGMALANAGVCQLIWLNPWWGVQPQIIETAPLINSLLVAYLAPAAVLGLASVRLYQRAAPLPARLYGAAAALLSFVWSLLALRQLFHGPRLWIGAADFAEWTCMAGLLLALPLVLRRLAPVSARADAERAAAAVSLVALPFTLLLVGVIHAPWWGLVATPPGAPWISGPALAGLVLLAWLNGRTASGGRRDLALVVAAAIALVGLTLATRWLFHPTDLRAAAAIRLETWAYSALWALFGAGLLALGSALRERALRWMALGVLFATAGKVLLFDMASLDGVIRAASFLAVGGLMVAAAVLARRLGRAGPGEG